MYLNEQILHCYCQTVFLPWRNLLCILTGAILKGVFYRSKDVTRVFKMLSWSHLFSEKCSEWKFWTPWQHIFLFPRNIKSCVYFTGNQAVTTEPCDHGMWGRLLGQSREGRLQGPPGDHPRPRAQSTAMVSRSRWIFSNRPLQVSQEEKSPSTHLYTEILHSSNTQNWCTAEGWGKPV